MCTQQEAATQELSTLKADKARLEGKIEILETEQADLIAEQVKLQTQTTELKENEWKLQELQVTFNI